MMVTVIVLVTMVTLVLGMVMQPLKTVKTRQLERELIYRGEHIAMGLRRYYFKFGRFPTKLEALVEGEPKFIRKLYKDPMSKEGEWILVYFDPSQAGSLRNLRNSGSGLSAGVERMLGQENQTEQNSQNQTSAGLSGGERSVFGISTQQIIGIRSASEVEGFREYQDSRIYTDWLFTAIPQQKRVTTKDLLNNIK